MEYKHRDVQVSTASIMRNGLLISFVGHVVFLPGHIRIVEQNSSYTSMVGCSHTLPVTI